MSTADVLGYIAASLTTIAFVPQAWKTFRTKDVSGVSLRMYSVFTTGVAFWLAYGLVLKEPPMILDYALGGAVTAALLAYLVYALIRPERF